MAKKLSNANKKALDSIPKPTKKKNEIPTFELPIKIRDAVDTFAEETDVEKQAKKTKDESKSIILDFMEKVIETRSENGEDFSKSYRLPGNSREVTFTKPNKFSIKADIEQLQKVAGKRFIQENFKEMVTLAVNPDVIADPKRLSVLLRRLRTAFGNELGEFFVQTKNTVPKEDLDKNFLDLPKEKRDKLKGLVIQASASIKLN